MPDTLTLPTAQATQEEPALHVCVWDHVARTVAWLDAANGRGPHETAVRAMKIAEESGEAVAAYIGLTGENPRKGVTAGPDDLAAELCDVVLAAPDRPGHDHWRHSTGRIGAVPARRRPNRPAARPANRRMTASAAARPASPPMRRRDFADLADEVAATCQRYGVRAWSDDDRTRLAAALWRFIHPDLAGTRADPYTDPDDY
jgi:hypothetical protein